MTLRLVQVMKTGRTRITPLSAAFPSSRAPESFLTPSESHHLLRPPTNLHSSIQVFLENPSLHSATARLTVAAWFVVVVCQSSWFVVLEGPPRVASVSRSCSAALRSSSVRRVRQLASSRRLSPARQCSLPASCRPSISVKSPLPALAEGERPWKTSDARLVLEDGSIWKAKSFGATGTQVGEVVFNTSLTGYQEILTDPSYAGQFVLMTNPHIDDVDTRAITRRLREDGSLIEQEWEFNSKVPQETFHVVAYDFGIKQNILRRLASYGCKITVVPSTWPASKTLKMKPDGVLFSNGPGDPSAVPYAVETVRDIIGKVPVFGICMGHQLLGQALGGKTFKMKFGHHGGNHPVRNLRTTHVEISAQNHNYAVDPATLPEGVEVTHINLNDGSCAGLAFPAKRIMSLQYHPEASPGPHDSDYAFREFVYLMRQEKRKKSEPQLSTV
ncbi:hypothetical protein Ahy_B10g102265 isoform B [Arachis hypogaea]|nr:hypothetical protein Ahy_B10g102265 isoform B [Arachis hypogaea]